MYTPLNLIGHSMGAGVACTYAGVYPESVLSLVMVEGAGPLSRSEGSVVRHLRENVDKRVLSNNSLFGEKRRARTYKSVEKAVDARVATAGGFPGEQYISREAAERLVVRGTRPVGAAGAAVTAAGAVEFSHDKRLQWPSLSYFSEAQVLSIMRSVTAPVKILKAEDGWPPGDAVDGGETERERRMEALERVEVVEVKGSHHCHADPGTVEECGREIVEHFYGRGGASLASLASKL